MPQNRTPATTTASDSASITPRAIFQLPLRTMLLFVFFSALTACTTPTQNRLPSLTLDVLATPTQSQVKEVTQSITSMPTEVPNSSPTPAPTRFATLTALPTTPDPPVGDIAFSLDGQQLYVIDSAGNNLRLLLDGVGIISEPQWRAAGRELVFLSDHGSRHGILDIFTLLVESGAQLRVTNDDFPDSDLALSPDGNRVVYKSERRENGTIRHDLYLTDLRSGATERLTHGEPSHNGRPAWSPDGASIAYMASHSQLPYADLFVMSLDDRETRRLTYEPMTNDQPRWSPDGQHMLVTVIRNESYYLSSIGVRDSQITPLLSGGVAAGNAVWSPSGEELLYETQEAVSTLNLDSGLNRKLFDIPVDNPFGTEPIWSPTGQYVAFALNSLTGGQQSNEIVIIDLSGSVASRFTPDVGCCVIDIFTWYIP